MLTPTARATPHMLRTVKRFASVVCISAITVSCIPCLYAQSDAPKVAHPVGKRPEPVARQLAQDHYSLKFDGGDVEAMEQTLKSKFPSDNVVIAPSAKHIPLGAFEVRGVQLKELGKTIEFLSEGRLTVEVVPGDGAMVGNIWRIASKNAADSLATVNLKMRSVAAPHLFAENEKLERVLKDAERLENHRMDRILRSAAVGSGNFSGVAHTDLKPLREQKVIVLIGSEDGISGMESFIKAAEQLAVDEAGKERVLAASLAPKMRAVFAPHLFSKEARRDQFAEELENVQGLWNESHSKLMQMVGIKSQRGGVCVVQRREQRLFVLYGSEDGINGVENLIQAAESNAADEDAKLLKDKAAIIELEQQREIAIQKLEFESAMAIDRREKLIAQTEALKKELQVQMADENKLSPENRSQLITSINDRIKSIEKAQAEADARSGDQITQLRSTTFEIEVRLKDARSKESPKE